MFKNVFHVHYIQCLLLFLQSQSPGHCTPEESLIDQSPYVTVTNGMVAPAEVDDNLTEAEITQN